ncbi:hypothetical protein [Salidesulfovibrio onnuriiensis]|uniref:hypothetical protein n=1 Tax=Salidesulfovibrio onnuriiensis TaxID=2583823 RepID=UPI0011CBC66A|nr:hypothetical protein [Salidesulfovibrio onnuriiensis]
MRRLFAILAVFMAVSALLAPALIHAESLVESTQLGYRMTIPDAWTTMNRAEIKALNDYLSEFLGTRVQGTELEVLAGYRPIGRSLVYPFIVVGADRSGKLDITRMESFNRHVVGNFGALLNTGVYNPAGSADDITGTEFDQENWTFTITAEPGGMLFRVRYVYTSAGVLVFRAFFDQRSMRLLPAVDRSFRSLVLEERLRYGPDKVKPESNTGSARNVWIIYAMALLVLIGVWLTDFPSDEGDNPQ